MEELNIGDEVIVLRKPTEDEEYDTSWISSMSNSIGKKYKIIDIHNISHDYKDIKLNNHYWYPNFVLCKIRKIELLEIF